MKNSENIGNTSHELLKNHFDGNFVKFLRQFLEELMKNCTETSDDFREKLLSRRNVRNIRDALENLSRGVLKLNPATENSSFSSINRLSVNRIDDQSGRMRLIRMDSTT